MPEVVACGKCERFPNAHSNVAISGACEDSSLSVEAGSTVELEQAMRTLIVRRTSRGLVESCPGSARAFVVTASEFRNVRSASVGYGLR